MISLPLPDELLRKVYSYIHPVFDYTEFVNALSHHAEEEEAFTLILDRRNNIDNIDDKITYYDMITTYALLMNKHLSVVSKFLRTNPRFNRPDYGLLLNQTQYRWQWDWSILPGQAARMDNNMYLRRLKHGTTTTNGYELHNIMVQHDIVFMLREGSLATIINNCNINNIDINVPGLYHGTEYRNALVQRLMAL